MSQRRAASVPASDVLVPRDLGGPNPFWSDKVREDWNVSRARPAELPPVPPDDGTGWDVKESAVPAVPPVIRPNRRAAVRLDPSRERAAWRQRSNPQVRGTNATS